MKRTISAVLCAALALTLAGCAEEKEPMLDRTVTVETTAAQTGELSTESTYIGTISAEGTASVVSLVSGNVEEVMVSVGDTVSAGDPLCRIDDESARLALQNAQAAYQSAQESYNSAQAGYGGADLPVLEEQLRLAQDNYEDTQHLFEMGAASQAEVDQANQALLSAQVGVNSAQYQLSLYNMTAPISGVVEAVNLTLNNFAASGTVAFVISNGSNKTVTFYVTDQVRQTLTAGQEVSVVSDGRTYQGAVTEISGVVDAATGLFKVKAVINEAQSLPDGLAVELTTTAYRSSGAVLIPSDAVYFDEGNAYVYVAQDGTAVRTEVTVGLYTADTIAVTSGLTAGDEVITTWSAGLKDGAPIRLAGQEEADGTADASGTSDASGSAAGGTEAP